MARKSPGRKFMRVMREAKAGTLKSGSGRKVRSRKQVLAIAFSEQRRANARRRKR
jgi:hypothetical protein